MKRLIVFDNIKFFLIVLVIYGHLRNVGCLVPTPLYKIIYSFHIPLFVFISGFFSKKQDKHFAHTIWNLFLLFVIFSVISGFINISVYHKPVFTSFFRTPFALWYLLCLIYWKTIIYFIPESILKTVWFVVIAFGISFLPMFLILDYLSLARCCSFFPFFLLGWLAHEFDWIERLDSLSHRTSLRILMCIISLFCCFLATKIPNGFYYGLYPIDGQFLMIFSCKIVACILALINSITVYFFIPKKIAVTEGKHTLFYYLYHTLLLFPVFDILVKYLPQDVFMSVAVLVCIMLLLFLMRRITILNTVLGVGK